MVSNCTCASAARSRIGTPSSSAARSARAHSCTPAQRCAAGGRTSHCPVASRRSSSATSETRPDPWRCRARAQQGLVDLADQPIGKRKALAQPCQPVIERRDIASTPRRRHRAAHPAPVRARTAAGPTGTIACLRSATTARPRSGNGDASPNAVRDRGFPVGLAAWILDQDTRSLELIARVFDGRSEGLTRDDRARQHHALLADEYGGSPPLVCTGRISWPSSPRKASPFPVAVSAFPDDICPAPRSWAERAYPELIHYNRLDKGGHFAAWEQPKHLSESRARGLQIAAQVASDGTRQPPVEPGRARNQG